MHRVGTGESSTAGHIAEGVLGLQSRATMESAGGSERRRLTLPGQDEKRRPHRPKQRRQVSRQQEESAGLRSGNEGTVGMGTSQGQSFHRGFEERAKPCLPEATVAEQARQGVWRYVRYVAAVPQHAGMPDGPYGP